MSRPSQELETGPERTETPKKHSDKSTLGKAVLQFTHEVTFPTSELQRNRNVRNHVDGGQSPQLSTPFLTV